MDCFRSGGINRLRYCIIMVNQNQMSQTLHRTRAFRELALSAFLLVICLALFVGYPILQLQGKSQASPTYVNLIGRNSTTTVTNYSTFTITHRVTQDQTITKNHTVKDNLTTTITDNQTITVTSNQTITQTITENSTITRTCTLTTDYEDGCCSYLLFCEKGR